ncbi:MAG: YggS family pyridoxal phosphate-dependent enzyme [Bacillota bacterium]|nr:MAG: YggS family pyridoxal phosphate-dependent enzyme [Bacillota bacterium]
MVEENVRALLGELSQGNNFGEPVTLVGASKTVDADMINRALSAGLAVVAENKVQEFNEKFPLVLCDDYQFIGHLQKNKVKYLVGRASLIQSVDSAELAEEIDRVSEKKGVVTDILQQVNIGEEATKSGFSPQTCLDAADDLRKLKNVRLKGLMAMLPPSSEEGLLADLCLQMREFYDILKKSDENIRHLSVGMSGDYKIAVKCGSNMVRLGSAIFGKRTYNV